MYIFLSPYLLYYLFIFFWVFIFYIEIVYFLFTVNNQKAIFYYEVNLANNKKCIYNIFIIIIHSCEYSKIFKFRF